MTHLLNQESFEYFTYISVSADPGIQDMGIKKMPRVSNS